MANKGHPRSAELYVLADDLDKAIQQDGVLLLSAWARARKLFTECGGEPIP